jgi:hypothetical protein
LGNYFPNGLTSLYHHKRKLEGYMDSILIILLGILLRLGIPIGLTALAVWFLKRLDARWQAEASRPVRVKPLSPPCWEQKSCPEAKRAVCIAYQEPDIPCWQLFRKKDGSLREGCLACSIFRTAPIPTTT